MSIAINADNAAQYAELVGIPKIDFPRNLERAVNSGRRMTGILREVIALRRGPGKLSPNEYFYYRLWDPQLIPAEKARFVGKMAQNPMHMRCNSTAWYATAADKLLFQTLMAGAGIPCPQLLAITAPGRVTAQGEALAGEGAIARFLRRPAHYPLFAKPIDGKFSLSVLSADGYDAASDRVRLHDGETIPPETIATTLAAHKPGYLIQRRLSPHPDLAALFGPRLWSIRMIMLITGQGPLLARAVAKIATGGNVADNFWRPGNRLGAINRETGRIERVVHGTGADMIVDADHPDTNRPILGTLIPDWDKAVALVHRGAQLLPGIRTQSWDIAITDQGPVALELNFGGDLNLAQLAFGAGMLDEDYVTHLHACGWDVRRGR